MKRSQILVGAIILIVTGILFIYGAYSASYGTGRWFSDRAKELFFSDIKFYIGIVFIGLGIFFWVRDIYANRDKLIDNGNRKFSAERLYKLVRIVVVSISILLFIASAITFYVSKSAQAKLNKFDKAIEFPRQYKKLSFTSLEDFLNYVAPKYPYSSMRYRNRYSLIAPEKQRKNEFNHDEINREELKKMIELPSGFNNVRDIKNYRNKLSDEIEGSKIFSQVSLLSAIVLQIIFWGIVWLYRYLFPIANIKNE